MITKCYRWLLCLALVNVAGSFMRVCTDSNRILHRLSHGKCLRQSTGLLLGPTRGHSERHGLKAVKAVWLSTSGEVEVAAPKNLLWSMWSKLEDMPKWQPWLHEVKLLEDNLSKWTLKKKVAGIPLSFSWIARSLPPDAGRMIHWEAVSGMRNKGRVEFSDMDDGATHLRMTIEYELPKIVSHLLRANDEDGYVNRKVQSIIQRDLETFKKIAENIHSQEQA